LAQSCAAAREKLLSYSRSAHLGFSAKGECLLKPRQPPASTARLTAACIPVAYAEITTKSAEVQMKTPKVTAKAPLSMTFVTLRRRTAPRGALHFPRGLQVSFR
jgi:hypothetical protein